MPTWWWLLTVAGFAGLAWIILVSLFTPAINYHLHKPIAASTPDFVRALSGIGQIAAHPHNHIDVLTNGPTFYPAMIEAIRSARHSVCLECYIFHPGRVANAMADALADRARDGVIVSMVADSIGSFPFWYSRVRRRLKKAGCRIHNYQGVRWYSLARLNNRTHRELLIIDGRIAFVGGAGVADWWAYPTHGKPHWRDTMLRVEGPVVNAIQGVFAENWLECSNEILDGDAFFPPLTPVGDVTAAAIKSSPSDRFTLARVAFQSLIEAAESGIRLNTPYFLPDRALRRALIRTARRGVKIQLILPGPGTDQKWVRLASRRMYGRLLKSGIRIFEYRPAMMHAKILLVDDCWALVGTTNMDNRSFEHNDEVNLAMRDGEVIERLGRDFAADLAVCDEVTLAQWRRRPLWERALNPIVWILERQQ
jgi:cardiolipin synthase A/B